MKTNQSFHLPLTSLAIAGLLVLGAVTATAQTPPVSAAGSSASTQGSGEHMRMRDPAKMQAMMAKHQADLKAKLKLTPAQEGAWTAFTAAMQPPAGWRPGDMQAKRAELEKLPTPERIDKMQALRAERMTQMNAEMDKRGAATKSFYAALTTEQQKTFDAERHMHRGERGAGRHGGANGDHPHQGMEPKKG
jgi:periplasmic protein CpxP/Spy